MSKIFWKLMRILECGIGGVSLLDPRSDNLEDSAEASQQTAPGDLTSHGRSMEQGDEERWAR